MGQFILPLGSSALVNSDSDCRVFFTVAPNVRSAYFAKSLNGAALICKFVEIFKKCRACFRNRYGFNSCFSHGFHKIAHVRCPGKFIAFKFAAVVVKIEFVSPVGFGYDADNTEGLRATTVPVTLNIRQSGFVGDDDNSPIPPTPDLYTQLLQKIKEKGKDGKSAYDMENIILPSKAHRIIHIRW